MSNPVGQTGRMHFVSSLFQSRHGAALEFTARLWLRVALLAWLLWLPLLGGFVLRHR